MPIPHAIGPTILAAVFAAGGHGKPALRAQVSITQPPHDVQLAKRISGETLNGDWWTNHPLATSGGTYLVTARAPHQECGSVTLTIPAMALPEQRVGGRYEVRISCARSSSRK